MLARFVAEKLHDGQLRKDGEDYFFHCYRVAFAVSRYGEHEITVGYLHDVLEDTEFPEVALDVLFGGEVVADVRTVTRRWSESYGEFIERICAEGSDAALRVKIADVNDNLSPALPSLEARYRRALSVLTREAVRRKIDFSLSADGRPSDP